MKLSWEVTGFSEGKNYKHILLAFSLGFAMVKCFIAVRFFFPYNLKENLYHQHYKVDIIRMK